MNNLQFIATYIHNNPNPRYTEIIRSLMLWKGFSADAIANIGGQYSRYFSRRYSRFYIDYHGKLWVKTDPKNRKSGFKLTPKGRTYITKGA